MNQSEFSVQEEVDNDPTRLRNPELTAKSNSKEFDVSDNLSFRMVPYVQPQQQQTGLSLQFHFKNSHSK